LKRRAPAHPETPAAHPDDTRARLLRAAAEVFARHGYETSTIRQICARAGANVALVNYYFGDKLELYTEVLRSSVPPSSSPAAGDPEQALRRIIAAMVDRAFETGDQACLRYRLMLHEFVHPTAATSRVVDVVMRPLYDRLREIVGAILELPPGHEKTRLCVHSVIGQVAHYAHSTPILTALWPAMKMTAAQRETVATHIADFTLAYVGRNSASRRASAL
jgi:TetR/AcrR family transcriptional regulator, regulator of cefoperazone and chloramphenicol sensitivity